MGRVQGWGEVHASGEYVLNTPAAEPLSEQARHRPPAAPTA
ncbi:hypothetical protein [Streptomyces zaehneri]|nr:hypothetical protein [Streptomyces sp. DSM 40713]